MEILLLFLSYLNNTVLNRIDFYLKIEIQNDKYHDYNKNIQDCPHVRQRWCQTKMSQSKFMSQVVDTSLAGAANETIYRNIDSRQVYLGKKLTSALNLRELSVIPNIIPLMEEHFQRALSRRGLKIFICENNFRNDDHDVISA